jgi:hypothetical protein
MKPKKTNEEMNGVAEVELVYHNKVKAADRPKIVDSKGAYKILLEYWNKDAISLIEEFKVILMNRAGRLLGIYDLSKGGISATTVDPGLIYIAALKAAASSIILAQPPFRRDQPERRGRKVDRENKEWWGTAGHKGQRPSDHHARQLLFICRPGASIAPFFS